MSILEEIYQDLVISSFGKIEVTKFGTLLGKGYSHDRFTKQLLLNGDLESDEKLWKTIKPFLRDYENEQSGCIIIDDMLMDKTWTKENDIVCWHYNHVSQRMQKGILMLNFHYTDDSGISIPLGYEVITKTEDVWSKEYKKNIKKSLFSKNEIMQDKLKILHYHNELKYKYVVFDKWFASMKNLVFIDTELNKKFVCPIKSNRKIALTLEEKRKGKYVSIGTIDTGGGSSRLIYLEGYEKPLRLIKQVVKDGDDGESNYLYLVTNDIDLSFQEILEIYKKR